MVHGRKEFHCKSRSDLMRRYDVFVRLSGQAMVIFIALTPFMFAFSGVCAAPVAKADAEYARQICETDFQSFVELGSEKLDFPLGHLDGIRSPVFRYIHTIDVDGDSEPERIYFSDRATVYSLPKDLSSVFFIVDEENAAFEEASQANIGRLHDVSIIRNASPNNFEYLSFDDGFQRLGLLNGKTKDEAWSEQDYKEYFKEIGLLDIVSMEPFPRLRAIVARLGMVGADLYFRLSARPEIFTEGGDGLLYFDNTGAYSGPRYEFLAKYLGLSEFSLECARIVINDSQ